MPLIRNVHIVCGKLRCARIVFKQFFDRHKTNQQNITFRREATDNDSNYGSYWAGDYDSTSPSPDAYSDYSGTEEPTTEKALNLNGLIRMVNVGDIDENDGKVSDVSEGSIRRKYSNGTRFTGLGLFD